MNSRWRRQKNGITVIITVPEILSITFAASQFLLYCYNKHNKKTVWNFVTVPKGRIIFSNDTNTQLSS